MHMTKAEQEFQIENNLELVNDSAVLLTFHLHN